MAYVEEMKCLGVTLDRKGSTGRTLEHRMSKANGLYGMSKNLLRNKKAPWNDKISAWAKVLSTSCGFWGGELHLRYEHLLHLKWWQNKRAR